MKAVFMGLVRFAVAMCVLAWAFVAAFRVMGSMMIYDDAQMLLGEPCPVQRTEENVCLVRGSLGHTLVTGDAQIKLQDGTTLIVPAASVRSTMFEQSAVRYEPFGKVFSGILGFGVLVLGGFAALSIHGWRGVGRAAKAGKEQT
jgi:hypothetical protein